MSNIILCDRCGKISAQKVAGGLSYFANQTAESRSYGLCPECSKELYIWLTQAGNEVKALMVAFDPESVPEPVVDQRATSEAALKSLDQ